MKKILLVSALVASSLFADTVELDLTSSERAKFLNTFHIESLPACGQGFQTIAKSVGKNYDVTRSVEADENNNAIEGSIIKEKVNLGLNYDIKVCQGAGAITIEVDIDYTKLDEKYDTKIKKVKKAN